MSNIENLKSAVVRKNARIIELESSLKKCEFYLYVVASKAGVLVDKVAFENDTSSKQTVQDVIIEARELLA